MKGLKMKKLEDLHPIYREMLNTALNQYFLYFDNDDIVFVLPDQTWWHFQEAINDQDCFDKWCASNEDNSNADGAKILNDLQLSKTELMSYFKALIKEKYKENPVQNVFIFL